MQLIVGVKGTGKTKALIEEVNKASRESSGSVVCIEYGRKLTFDIKYQARLIDALDYEVNDAEKLYGFVCGILAGNYDVTQLFIDSALKICGDDIPSFETFILKTAAIAKKNNIECIITASVSPELLPASLKEYIREAH